MIPHTVTRLLERLRATVDETSARERLAPSAAAPARAWRLMRDASPASVEGYWRRLLADTPVGNAGRAAIADPASTEGAAAYSANIESYVGTTKVPVAVVGPLRVNGLNAKGDYLVPLATTEAALVASYARGAEALSRSGGASAALLYEGVLRSPAFVFEDLLQAGMFVEWVCRNVDGLREAAEATTRFGRLVEVNPVINCEVVFLLCRYTTGDASGQNMVTIATEALCRRIEAECPVKPRRWFLEGNYSGDKKGSYLGLSTGRGRKVTASARIPAEVVRRVLRTEVDVLLDYAKVASLGATLSGQLGAQGHYANGLAALYLATGQDVACVSESSVGITRMEERGGDLHVSVTLPNVLVGTVGGGTGLPSQAAALRVMGLEGAGNAAALAEVAACLCLAGELSIMAALSAGHFAHAHRKLARRA